METAIMEKNLYIENNGCIITEFLFCQKQMKQFRLRLLLF